MSEYINAKRLYKGKTFDEVKRLFPNCIWKKIPNIRVKAYSSNTGLVFKDRTISYSSVLYDCNNDLNVYTRLCLLGGKSNKAHRYIISAFLGESNLEVNHKDCNKGNNHLNNLEYMTRKENANHAVKNGRFPKHICLTDEERKRRGDRLRDVNKKMKLGIIPRNIHHTKWTEEHKQKYREYLKSRPRDNYGRFTKGGGV